MSFFTGGQCHALAAAISAETGYDMVLVHEWCEETGEECLHSDEDEGDGCDETVIWHCVVALPDGRYLDAAGTHTAEDLRGRGDQRKDAELELVPSGDAGGACYSLSDEDNFDDARLDVAEHFVSVTLAQADSH